jgi:hypothetical protein
MLERVVCLEGTRVMKTEFQMLSFISKSRNENIRYNNTDCTFCHLCHQHGGRINLKVETTLAPISAGSESFYSGIFLKMFESKCWGEYLDPGGRKWQGVEKISY